MVRLGEQVGNRARAEAGEDKVSEVKFDILRLVRPLLAVSLWVKELYIRM